MVQPPPKWRKDTSDYRRLFLEDVPLFDVRAPIEFAKGSVPLAVNLPLMTDSEREAIGIAYKEEGQDAAIAKGHGLVCGDAKAQRVASWSDFAHQHPDGYLFCMRGGLRSQISQQWMVEAGSPYPLIKGGYKALRRFLIEETERLVQHLPLTIVAGRTGSGKTDFLQVVENAVDLEDMANHRGSSFGRRPGDQPTQINFENTLAVRLLKQEARRSQLVFIEDEGRRIGGLEVPLILAEQMANAPVVIIEEPLAARAEIIHRDYIVKLSNEYADAFGEEGHRKYAEFMREALHRIRKRLGGVRYSEVGALLDRALEAQGRYGNTDRHFTWIELLLRDYYDPMYEYQMANNTRSVLFSGSRAEVTAWAQPTSPAVQSS